MPDPGTENVTVLLSSMLGGSSMRVCFLEDTDLHGGTQIWVVEAAQNFLKAGTEVTVLTSESGWVAEQCAKTDARLVTYNYHEVVGRDDAHKELWAEALGDSDVAVCTVHPPRDTFHCSVFAGEVIKEKGLKTILIPKTGTIVPEYKREFYWPEPSIRSTVIAITNFTREYLVDTYRIPEEMVTLIYQGTDVQLFTRSASRRREARRHYPLPENAGPVLGNVGSFEERKGQVKLLEAVIQIKKSLPRVHLMLVGDGPDEKKLKRMVKDMDLSDNVTFFPFTSEPVYIYEVMDILVLASLYKEGLPNVLLEAMSMELPVIASRLAGIPEVVKEERTGYMVEPGNGTQLTDSVVKLWSDRDAYRDMARNARQLMASRFDKQRQFRAFLEYFEELL
jgi:glycosyltransferase involved in cell wall biosynthesis